MEIIEVYEGMSPRQMVQAMYIAKARRQNTEWSLSHPVYPRYYWKGQWLSPKEWNKAVSDSLTCSKKNIRGE
jgi:hypothetical protein